MIPSWFDHLFKLYSHIYVILIAVELSLIHDENIDKLKMFILLIYASCTYFEINYFLNRIYIRYSAKISDIVQKAL